MKKLIIMFVMVVCLAGCGSSSSSGGGTAPTLSNVEMVQPDSYGSYHVDHSISNGEYYNLNIYASDPDLNLVEAEVNYYMGETFMEGPQIISFPTQSSEAMVYSFISDRQVTDTELGNWRIEVVVIDSTNKKSRVFSINVVVETGSGQTGSGTF